MKTLTTKRSQSGKKPNSPLGQYATAEDAAKAKNTDFMKSLEKVDLSFLRNK